MALNGGQSAFEPATPPPQPNGSAGSVISPTPKLGFSAYQSIPPVTDPKN